MKEEFIIPRVRVVCVSATIPSSPGDWWQDDYPYFKAILGERGMVCVSSFDDYKRIIWDNPELDPGWSRMGFIKKDFLSFELDDLQFPEVRKQLFTIEDQKKRLKHAMKYL